MIKYMIGTKVAVVSDIHANMDALNSFVKYINDKKIEVVLNLGDFISNGPNPCEVFDFLMKDKRFINVRGYDEEILFNDTKLDEGIGQGRWLKEKLGPTRLLKLRSIPSKKIIELNEKKFLLVHHNGWSDIEQIIAHTEDFKNEKYDFLLCGGTHLQEYVHEKKYCTNANIIDPGTLGAARNGLAYFAILNLENKEATVRFHNAKIESCFKEEVKYLQDSKIKTEKKDNELVFEDNALKDTFLYIQGSKQGKDSLMYINDEVIEQIIQIGINKCHYVSIGCWSKEQQIIREILYYLKCRRIKKSEKDNQEWYIGEITSQVVDLLLNKRNLSNGKLKWFEISFQSSLEDVTPIYSIFQYGKQGYLKRLTQKELYTMQDILKKYHVLYTLPEENVEQSDK